MKSKVPAMRELISKLPAGANDRCVVVLQLYDSSFHLARTAEGSLLPACKTGEGLYHVHGEAIVAPKESQFAAFTATKDVLAATGKLQKIIVSPLPRYLYAGCCSDPEHCTNISSVYYKQETEAAILACRRNLKDFCFRHHICRCKIICPWRELRQQAGELWITGDPVHMSGFGYDVVANMVLEAATGASDLTTKKRPLARPENSKSKRSHN